MCRCYNMIKISLIITQFIIQVLLAHQFRKVQPVDTHNKERVHPSSMVLCLQTLKESPIRYNRNLMLTHSNFNNNNNKQLLKYRKKSSKDKIQYLKLAILLRKEMLIRKKEVEES